MKVNKAQSGIRSDSMLRAMRASSGCEGVLFPVKKDVRQLYFLQHAPAGRTELDAAAWPTEEALHINLHGEVT